MKYGKIIAGTFISRLNRFIANVEINGITEVVHVKNTGRCKELLVPGAKVWLEVSDNPTRKTGYDLVAVLKESEGRPPVLINMDSQIVNACAEEWIKKKAPNALIRREVTYGKSRFDIYVEEEGGKKVFVEVKGVTLERDGIALFPDAPTERGIKHLNELVSAVKDGYEAYVMFIIQMKGVRSFSPNDATHKAFGDALRNAAENGVRIIALDCNVTEDSVSADEFVRVVLQTDGKIK